MEQEEYTKEEIDWSYIEFVDNQDVLDLIEKTGHTNRATGGFRFISLPMLDSSEGNRGCGEEHGCDDRRLAAGRYRHSRGMFFIKVSGTLTKPFPPISAGVIWRGLSRERGEEKPTADPNRPLILSSNNSDQASHKVEGEIQLCSSVYLSFTENELIIETGRAHRRVVAEPLSSPSIWIPTHGGGDRSLPPLGMSISVPSSSSSPRSMVGLPSPVSSSQALHSPPPPGLSVSRLHI
ncbi:hypothetical protein U1Q18_039190 [Sarracenia purpurea var. burkii]